MTARAPQESLEAAADLPGVAEIVRRVVGARVRDPDTVDDLVQESLTRVLEARPRLEETALLPYAIVTARNLVVSLVRSESRRKRHSHRLIDLRKPDAPEEEALRQEERRAVAAALTHLPPGDRTAVVAHELEGTDTATLAQTMESTPGGVAARLARARARLRVEYLIALRNQDPPTARCRPVLLALSSGDRRRQAALDAGAHLYGCAHCAALSEAVLGRRRGLEGFAPLALFGGVGGAIGRALRSPQVQWGTGTITVCTAVVALTGAPAQPVPTPASSPLALVVTLGGEPVHPSNPGTMKRFAGRDVRGRDLSVQAVPADEGFWVGPGPDGRMWVQLPGGGESGSRVAVGERVSFRGTMVDHGRRFPERIGVRGPEGAGQLRSQGVHIEVRPGDLRIR